MYLGQLYYYDKKLDEIKFPISFDEIPKIELFGLEEFSDSELQGLSSAEISTIIRDKFTDHLEKIFKEENFNFNYKFWGNLTSPKKELSKMPVGKNEFQNKLLSWSQNGFLISDLSEILNLGKLTSSEEDFMLYYGLKALFLMSQGTVQIPKSEQEIEAVEKDTNFDPSSDPEILVLGQRYLAPLFVNLNCLWIPLPQTQKLALDKILGIVSDCPSIKVVLITNDVSASFLSFLQSHLPAEIFLTNLDLLTSGKSENTFFDQIVRETLGIRLVDN